MEIHQYLERYHSAKPLTLSIGMFDGVHLGHQEIIHRLNEVAKAKNLESAILTFTPHPRLVFNPEDNLKFLNTSDEKTNLLKKSGIEHLFIQKFNENFRTLSGEEFVREILVKTLNVKYIIIGYDHTFGKNRSGNFELLQKLGSELGFEVEQTKAFHLENTAISSTKIRNQLQNSNIINANEMLGYKYSISGKVIHGKKLGRTIGYPTANIEFDSSKLLPQKGAYIVEVLVKDNWHRGMLSIGTNPTVGGEKLSVEVYILDFEDDIYDENITILLRDFLHQEIKFESLEKLIERLDEDKKLTEKFFG